MTQRLCTNASTANVIRDQLRKFISDIIFDALRETILAGDLATGTQLKEKNPAEEFGVSKTPVREALHHLSHIGQVDLQPAKGATVHRLTPEANNHLLVQWLDSLSDWRRLVSMTNWDIANSGQKDWEEYRAILDAVEAGDVSKASEALKDHIGNFSRQVMAHIRLNES